MYMNGIFVIRPLVENPGFELGPVKVHLCVTF